MNRTGRNTVRYKYGKYRVALAGVREGDFNAEVLDNNTIRLTTPEGVREIPIPPPPEEIPEWHSEEFPVLNAMYALAVHEVLSNRNEQGILTAGKSWDTAWTRDIAFAAVLGAHFAAPEECRRTLKSRVKNGIIVQDTGTGGGWPISTDRVSWALGAWSCYLADGNQEWLDFSINTLIATLNRDAEVLAVRYLIPGETSFLDWREQSYPRGMTPAEIGSSYALSTNVLHYLARNILARMLAVAGRTEEAAEYAKAADRLGDLINIYFHRPNSCKYAMYLTPDGVQDPHVDSLAVALAVLSDLAGRGADKTLQAIERTIYGVPVLAPFRPDVEQVYHNLAIWPFAEAFVMLAFAKQRNVHGVEFCAMSMLRTAMLNVTNKENIHAQTGSAADTVSNSDAQLWSAAGMLAFFYRVLLGIRLNEDCVIFAPCIPQSLATTHTLRGLRIRDMVLDVNVTGWGSEVEMSVNGMPSKPCLPLNTVGRVRIDLKVTPVTERDIGRTYTIRRALQGLATPVWSPDSTAEVLRWYPVPGAKSYSVTYNGRFMRVVTKPRLFVSHTHRIRYRAYRVQAFCGNKFSSPSVPFEYISPQALHVAQPLCIGDAEQSYPVENQQAWLDTRPCTSMLTYEKVQLEAGRYGVRVFYCNATASLRDADTCALRELHVDGNYIGMMVLPHNTEQDQWDDYSLSAMVECQLASGEHRFSLCFTPRCTNMNGNVNQCMVRQMQIIRLE